MNRKSRYKLRADGRREASKSYNDFGIAHFSGTKHFYGKTDQEIDQKILAFEASLNQAPETYKLKMNELAEQWWEEKQAKISPNSIGSFRAKYKEICSHFHNIPVENIDACDIYDWLNEIAGKGYAQKGINDRLSVIRQIFQYGVASKVISRNPCTDVPAVKGKKAKKRHPASDKDIDILESVKSDSLISKMFYFMEYTGCRIGECVVLQEKDIDIKKHKAKIYKDVAYESQIPIVKFSTKSEAGEREVDLYDNVIEILPHYDDPETYIFFPNGLPRKSRLETEIRNFKKGNQISATCHQLRHTYAGIMHSAEIDMKDRQARLGHSSIKVTMDVYTEIENAYNEKVRLKMNDYVMNDRLGKKKIVCKSCGCKYTSAEDGHKFFFCPDCGALLLENISKDDMKVIEERITKNKDS